MDLIPFPHNLQQTQEVIQHKAVCLSGLHINNRLSGVLSKLPAKENGIPLHLDFGCSQEESYTLDISNQEITITAPGIKGAFYALQTLRQVLENDTVYACHIEDKPDFAHRGFYHDVTRGKVPTLQTLKALVDELAYLKYNSLQLYVEHTFAFKEYADAIEHTGYLTAEEIRELDDYCEENFIELIPSLSCFGHLYELLQRPAYQHLQEAENFSQQYSFWWERQLHHTIDPLNPESFQLIKSLIDQFIPLFRSDKFNICCDETFDLAKGKHKDMDIGALYTDFVCQVISYVKSQGKQVMMWGDVLLRHPQQVDRIPMDVLLLNWEYGDDAQWTESKIKCFADYNRTQIVCPGTQTWKHLCEKVGLAITNISNLASLGKKYGAVGILNTNWGDYGNICSLELSQFGLAFGAEKSWNTDTDLETFTRSIDKLIYTHCGAYEILKRLDKIEDSVRWSDLVLIHSNLTHPGKLDVCIAEEAELLQARQECKNLQSELEAQQWENDCCRQELLLAAEGLEVMSELLLKLKGSQIARETDTASWLAKYRAAWLERNKPSELREIETMMMYLDHYIK